MAEQQQQQLDTKQLAAVVEGEEDEEDSEEEEEEEEEHEHQQRAEATRQQQQHGSVVEGEESEDEDDQDEEEADLEAYAKSRYGYEESVSSSSGAASGTKAPSKQQPQGRLASAFASALPLLGRRVRALSGNDKTLPPALSEREKALRKSNQQLRANVETVSLKPLQGYHADLLRVSRQVDQSLSVAQDLSSGLFVLEEELQKLRAAMDNTNHALLNLVRVGDGEAAPSSPSATATDILERFAIDVEEDGDDDDGGDVTSNTAPLRKQLTAS
ncbi:nucleolin [Balamuthia mandrillaris]